MRAPGEYEPVREHRASQSVAGKNGGCRLEYRQLDTEIVGSQRMSTGQNRYHDGGRGTWPLSEVAGNFPATADPIGIGGAA